MKRTFLPLIAIFVFLSLTLTPSESYARATATEDEAQPSQTTKYEDIISQDMSIGLQAGYGDKFIDNDHIVLNTVFLQPYFTLPVTNVLMKDSILRGILEYKLEIPLGLITSYHDRGIAGLSPLGFRYDLTGLKDRWVPYSQLSLGMAYFDVPRHVEGTRYDFLLSAALGVQYFITDEWTISAECRYFHISNSGIREPNQGENYIVGLVGIGRYFK